MKQHDSNTAPGGLIADMPDDLKPREKALSQGIKSLTDAELMALIFATGIKGKSVVRMCEEILGDNDWHISKVARMDVREFMRRYKGIGPAKALTMLAALELGSRAGADALRMADISIRDSQSAYAYMKPYLDGLDHEEFWLLLLKNNCKPIRAVRVGQGGLTQTVVDIKVLLREALVANAPAIMLFHNHPSGTLAPSANDVALTDKIRHGATTVDIRVLDHIIIGIDSYYSFHDEGRL